jgi:hypothetical protein
MASNKKRSEDYRKTLADLKRQLDFQELYETFRAKLIDMAASGRFTGDKMLEFIRQIEPLFDPEFKVYLGKIYKDYDRLVDAVNQYYKDIGTDVDRDLKKIQAIEKVILTQMGKYEETTVQAMARETRAAILAHETTSEFAARLANKLDDKVVGYAHTIARSRLAGYGQALKNEKSSIGEVYYHEYVGRPIRPQSHLFCVHMFDQSDRTFHVSDIRQMKNGQLEPVATYRAGYNCQHEWEPDPFYKDADYKIRFVDVMDGNREIRIGRHV